MMQLIVFDRDWETQLRSDGGGVRTENHEFAVYGLLRNHEHGDGSLYANNHSHDDGSYRADDHDHSSGSYEVPVSELSSITFGDDVSDADNVNATGFNWELREVVNGVSTVRHSGSETFTGGTTFINEIDISNNGLYPNNTGNWQLWIYPNSSNADLVKGRINIQHQLDNK